ncbi:MAG: hypothetical protein ACRCSN_19740 [Dermatophilaceae bacterium]
MTESTESGVTIKSGVGFDATWYTPKGSPKEIALWLVEMFGLSPEPSATPFEITVMAEELAQARYNAAKGLGATLTRPAAQATQQPQAQAAPALASAQQGPPAGSPPPPQCSHGARVYRTGPKKNGGEWKAYFCPAPKGDPSQCDAEWVR